MINIQAIIAIFTLLMLLAFLFKWLGKLSSASVSLGKWVVIGLGGLVLTWGIYNFIGSRFQLWEPLSLDKWLAELAESMRLDALYDYFRKWLGWF